jgi:dolichyl-phosphate beta-glucosyltransferase
VVVPSYREERRIAASVLALREGLGGDRGDVEIVVVDDGSGDATGDRAVEAGADQVIRFPVNRGKGAAVRAGMLAAIGSTVVFTDADLSYPATEVLRVRDAVEQGWDVVVGSRRHLGSRHLMRTGGTREVSGRVFNLFTRLVLPRPFGDTQCGLKGFHADAAQRVFGLSRVDGFAFDVELLRIAEEQDLAVTEVPVALSTKEGSTVHLEVDAVRMLRDLWRIRALAKAGAYRSGGVADGAGTGGREVAPD